MPSKLIIRDKVRILLISDLPVGLFEGRSSHPIIEKVIVHIHGGGFIAMSPDSHQSYSRRWARDTKALIFSIDYPLAPESSYPVPLDDIWQAYYWIIKHSSNYINVDPKKVVIVGDSAGGNFTAALTLKIISEKFRIPDGILMGYPALNLCLNSFVPSLLIALEDSILRYSFLMICIKSYIGNGDSTNPFVSPAFASDTELEQFPVTRFMIAGRDPLRDEALKMIDRMLSLKKDVKFIEYTQSPHGFWQFGIPHILDSAVESVTRAASILSEMLHT